MMRWSSDRVDAGRAMIACTGAGDANTEGAGTRDLTGALEHPAQRAPSKARTDRLPTSDFILRSPSHETPRCICLFTPTANVSEVAVRRPPSVDGQDLARDERRGGRGQKDCYFTYFFRGADASHGCPPGQLLGVQDASGREHGDELRPHIAGSDGIDPHSPRRPLDG